MKTYEMNATRSVQDAELACRAAGGCGCGSGGAATAQRRRAPARVDDKIAVVISTWSDSPVELLPTASRTNLSSADWRGAGNKRAQAAG